MPRQQPPTKTCAGCFWYERTWHTHCGHCGVVYPPTRPKRERAATFYLHNHHRTYLEAATEHIQAAGNRTHQPHAPVPGSSAADPATGDAPVSAADTATPSESLQDLVDQASLIFDVAVRRFGHQSTAATRAKKELEEARLRKRESMSDAERAHAHAQSAQAKHYQYQREQQALLDTQAERQRIAGLLADADHEVEQAQARVDEAKAQWELAQKRLAEASGAPTAQSARKADRAQALPTILDAMGHTGPLQPGDAEELQKQFNLLLAAHTVTDSERKEQPAQGATGPTGPDHAPDAAALGKRASEQEEEHPQPDIKRQRGRPTTPGGRIRSKTAAPAADTAEVTPITVDSQ